MSYLTSKTLIRKQPAEVIKTGMDFTNWVETSVVLSSPTVTSEIYGGCTTDLTIGTPTVNDKVIEFTVAGGSEQNRYVIEVTVVTDSGETLVADGILEVIDR